LPAAVKALIPNLRGHHYCERGCNIPSGATATKPNLYISNPILGIVQKNRSVFSVALEQPREILKEDQMENQDQNKIFSSILGSKLFWVIAAYGLNFEVYFFWRRFFWLPIPTSTILAWITSVFFAFLYNQNTLSFSSSSFSFFRNLFHYFGSHLLYGILDLSLMILFIVHFRYTQFSSKLLTLLIVFFLGFVVTLYRRKSKTA
jgi:putative flippase GtrA